MKKRAFALFLLACSLFMCSCSKTNMVITHNPVLEKYVNSVKNTENPTREYGENESFLLLEGNLLARILYPKGDVPAIDDEIQSWVQKAADYYGKEIAEATSENPAELSLDYESFTTCDRFVSVRIKGIFDHPYLAHPVDVVKTFNADRVTGKLLDIEDILLSDGKNKLLELVINRFGIEREDADDGVWQKWLIKGKGIQITLQRGTYLPSSDGTREYTFGWSELSDIVNYELMEFNEEKRMPLTREEKEHKIAQTTESDGPVIALTFDDGPSIHTPRLLDIFAQNGGRGTFFVVGNLLDQKSNVLKRMAVSGHQISAHGWDHRRLTNLDNEEEVKNQIMLTRAKIFHITGVDFPALRPPYGSFNDEVISVCTELSVPVINWSVDTEDWKVRDADYIYNCIMDSAKDGAIILCHDLYDTTVDAMERAIPDLIAKGYRLVTVNELLTKTNGIPEAGKIYYGK